MDAATLETALRAAGVVILVVVIKRVSFINPVVVAVVFGLLMAVYLTGVRAA